MKSCSERKQGPYRQEETESCLFLEACRPLHLRDCLAETRGTRLPVPRGRGHSSKQPVPCLRSLSAFWGLPGPQPHRLVETVPGDGHFPNREDQISDVSLGGLGHGLGRLSEELRRVAPSSEESTATFVPV